jgi:hypothetical protein
MSRHRILFRLISLWLSTTLAVAPILVHADITDSQQCQILLQDNSKKLVEDLFNEQYANRIGSVGKKAYALLKDRLGKKIAKRCRLGCTDAELAALTKDTLDHLFLVSSRIDKYTHIMGGWIVLASSLVGLSMGSYFLSQHTSVELTTSISTLVSVTAAMLLNPIVSSPASTTFRGLYRVIVFGLPFFRDDAVVQSLHEQSSIVRAKQSPLEAAQAGRNMQVASYAGSRAKEAADLIASTNQETGPGRAASNLSTIAILAHRYFPETNPVEENDVTMIVHQLFTQWLPKDWTSREKRIELFRMAMTEIIATDKLIRDQRDKDYYRLLVGKWLDLPMELALSFPLS